VASAVLVVLEDHRLITERLAAQRPAQAQMVEPAAGVRAGGDGAVDPVQQFLHPGVGQHQPPLGVAGRDAIMQAVQDGVQEPPLPVHLGAGEPLGHQQRARLGRVGDRVQLLAGPSARLGVHDAAHPDDGARRVMHRVSGVATAAGRLARRLGRCPFVRSDVLADHRRLGGQDGPGEGAVHRHRQVLVGPVG
jgi:hypothetical protein